MFCKNCGKTLNQGEMFCSNCGAKVETENNMVGGNTLNQNVLNPTTSNINNFDNNANVNQQSFNQSFVDNQASMGNMYQQPTYTPQQPQKKKNNLVKILAIIGGIVVGFIILFIVIFSITSASSEKLVCKSDEGNITIMYNEKGITGYTATGMSYELDTQQEYAKEIGMDAYITEFDNWFKSNTSGYCTINGEKVSEENNVDEDIPNQDIVQDGKRVGSDEFGYITIPENWANFVDVDGNSTLQYSYANVYIATLYAVPTTQISAYNYASNIMTKLQSEGVQNVQGATVSVGKYSAYQVYGYYANENIWLVCWFFEAEDGKTHYISIEGPDNTSEHFNIPNTFSLTK